MENDKTTVTMPVEEYEAMTNELERLRNKVDDLAKEQGHVIVKLHDKCFPDVHPQNIEDFREYSILKHLLNKYDKERTKAIKLRTKLNEYKRSDE